MVVLWSPALEKSAEKEDRGIGSRDRHLCAPTLSGVGDRARNTIVLAACLGLAWTVVQLLAALGAVTLSELGGPKGIAGLAPALFLIGWALAGPVAGRFMDTHGRRLGLAIEFAVGAGVGMVVWAGVSAGSTAVFLVGIALLGMAIGAVNLGARAGAADMYPPERRARGISYVLVGAALGSILSPLAFSRFLGDERGLGTLAMPWLIASGVMAAGALVTLVIRRDPIRFDQHQLVSAAYTTRGSGRPIRELIRLPLVAVALASAVVAQSVMSATMSIVGLALVEHGHSLRSVSLSLSVHFLGMFSLVVVVGQLVDRIGRRRAMLGGLVIVASGTGLLGAGDHLSTVMPAMFLIGVGWNLAFVAATVLMADAAEANERARLLGFGDLVAMGCAAAMTLAAGAVLQLAGLAVLALAGALLAVVPVLVGLASSRSMVPVRSSSADG